MINLDGVSHFTPLDEIVQSLCERTQNKDRAFFQAVTAYFMCMMASNMRAKVITQDRGEIPVNCYAIALAESGFGKGHSISIIENEIINRFRKRFTNHTMEVAADKHFWKLANTRSAQNGTGQQEEYDTITRDYAALGPFSFVFDSGTAPAVKQLRDKLLYASAGSINFQMDELGSNLEGNTEVLNVFLELFDQGQTKIKLTKNTKENSRIAAVDGKTPANMLLFGTPDKVFDGHSVEKAFHSFLEIGYARRCIFGEGNVSSRIVESSDITEERAEAVYDSLANSVSSKTLETWSQHFYDLANPSMIDWTMDVPRDVGIRLMQYKMACESAADKMASHEAVPKAELAHRYFKALKIAGAFAFIDQSLEVEMDHLMSAILLVEESGRAFIKAMDRPANYEKLARFIAEHPTPVTHPQIMEKNSFYKQSSSIRNDLMSNAIAWGYDNHIIIKKTFVDGVERFSGETLQETDTSRIKISYSDNFAYNYGAEEVPFEDLHQLTQAQDMHWCNHAFKNEHRCEENVIPGFNMLVVDVDGSASLEAVHELLKEYKFMTYTTKRSTDEVNRFRLMMPTNYELSLDAESYKELMNSFLDWLPFASDEGANQRSKKWQTYEGGEYHYNDGQLIDVLPFIPKTQRNADHQNAMKELQSLDNLERWFAQRIASGNRNNQMIRFALQLADSGMDLIEVRNRVLDFNKKLSSPLPESEIESTIMVTVSKKLKGASQ